MSATAKTSSRTGETLGGRYRLGRQVSVSRTTERYEATDTESDSAVVVRVLQPEFALHARVVDDFVAMPRQLASLAPPHTVRVLAVSTDDTGIPFVVEEALPDCETLAARLSGAPSGVPLAEACAILAPVIEAIARLHLAGLVHGNLNPETIVLLSHGGRTLPRLLMPTHDDAQVALVAYRAPECRERDAVSEDPAQDVWALGMLMHHVLRGSLATPDCSASQLMRDVPEWPPTLVTALCEAMLTDSAERLPDAGTLWMRVEGALAQLASKVKPSLAGTAPVPVRGEAPGKPSGQTDPLPPVEQPALRSDPLTAVGDNTATSLEADLDAARMAAPTPLPGSASAEWEQPVAPLLAADGHARRPPPVATVRARTPGQLTDAQLRDLMHLSEERENRAWPWVRWVLLLLLLLLLYRAVPLMGEPDFATARRVLGGKVKIAGVVLAVATVAVMVRTWAMASKGNALLLRPVLLSAQAVALCVCVLVGGALAWGWDEAAHLAARGLRGGGAGGGYGGGFGGSAMWQATSAMARSVLPYSVVLLFLTGGIVALMRGLQSMRTSMAWSGAMLTLALAGGAASVDIAVSTIKPQLQRRTRDPRDGSANADAADIVRIKEAFRPRAINLDKTPDHVAEEAPKLRERTSVGGSEEGELIMEDMRRQRAHQRGTIKAADKELPAVPR